MCVFDPGEKENLKGAVHGAALLLAAICGGYNAIAFLRRREAHLAINTALYVGIALWELEHVKHHARRT